MTTFYEYMKSYDLQELKEICQHGCVSGCASGLIYYSDTVAMYDKYRDEMHEKLGEWIDEIGETPTFITEHLDSFQQFANAMTWFVAEQYANEIVQTMECLQDD
jgi:hypothetical protein